MTFLLALLLMSQIQKATIFDKIVPVEATKIVRMPFDVPNPQTTLNLTFAVAEKNGTVKVVVRKAQDGTLLGETSYQAEGELKVLIADEGKIWIDVDNRARRLSDAKVDLTIKTSWKIELPVNARELPESVKSRVVVGSLGFLILIVGFSGWKLIPIWNSRR